MFMSKLLKILAVGTALSISSVANAKNITFEIPDFTSAKETGTWASSNESKKGIIKSLDWNEDTILDTHGYFTSCSEKPFAVKYGLIGGVNYHFDKEGKFKGMTFDDMLALYESKNVGDFAPDCENDE